MRLCAAGLILGVVAGSCAQAQSVISAHSGVIHYVEGRVLLADAPVEPKFGQFPLMRDGQELRTEEGRAEILLTPGAFLRVGENSSVRMLSNRLSDTRVEVLSGSALIECDELLKDNAITISYQGATMTLLKHGLYRVDAEAGRFRVYDGEAQVKNEAGELTLKKGKEALLNGALTAEKFDPKTGDELLRWADRRAGYVSLANVAAAKSLRDGGYGWGSSAWRFNPWFGMFTFVPYSGIAYSPFGYGFWSPYSIGYYPYYAYSGPAGGGGGGSSNAGTGRVYNSNSANSSFGSSSVGRSAAGSGGGTGGGMRSAGGGGAISAGGGGFGHGGHH